MKTVKSKLLLMILCAVLMISLIFGISVYVELTALEHKISEKNKKAAQNLSEKNIEELDGLYQQVATDFTGACSNYFNRRFQAVGNHAQSAKKYMEYLYARNQKSGTFDTKHIGLAKGIDLEKAKAEYLVLSQLNPFIKNLPDYDPVELGPLDVYVVTESGMCIDGTDYEFDNPYIDLRKEVWYQETKKSQRKRWSGIFKGKVSGKVKVNCVFPIYDKKTFKGCAAADIQVGEFEKMVDEFSEKQIQSIMFFDSEKEPMYGTNGYYKSEVAKDATTQTNEKDQTKETTANYETSVKNAKENIDKDIFIGKDEIYAYTTIKETGWTICLILNKEMINEAAQQVRNSVDENANAISIIVKNSIRESLLIFIIVIAIAVGVMFIVTNLVANGFVHPIRQLTGQVKLVGEGNLDQEIYVTSKDEIGKLAMGFNKMVMELKDYMTNIRNMTADKERMTAEIDIARQIQMNMLPKAILFSKDTSSFDISAKVEVYSMGGGNFYDFFLTDPNHLCMVMGNVSSEGIPTTMFSVVANTHIRNYAKLGYVPKRILAETNNQLCIGNNAELTVSVFLAILNLETGVLEYVNAQQCAPLYKEAGNGISFLKARPCVALGGMENVPFQQQEVTLVQGDMLFFHDKGVGGATDHRGSEYTQEYLSNQLAEIMREEYSLDIILDKINEDINAFTNNSSKKTDRTMMIFRYHGTAE